MATYNSQAPITVTLPDIKWGTIRTAVLCLAVEERLKGNTSQAQHFMDAYKALKQAMGS